MALIKLCCSATAKGLTVRQACLLFWPTLWKKAMELVQKHLFLKL